MTRGCVIFLCVSVYDTGGPSILFFRMSDLLAVVEAHLGSVERWPSAVLMDMFFEELKADVIKRVASFMYGNCVSVSDAMDCYNACNVGMYRSYVDMSLKAWYHVRDRDKYQRHKVRYYSMVMKCEAWINGKALDQCEVVKPVVAVREFGPAGMHCPLLIGSKIDFVRSGGDVLMSQ